MSWSNRVVSNAGARIRRLDNEERAAPEHRSRYVKFVVGGHKSPDPAERGRMRLQFGVGKPPIKIHEFLYASFMEEKGVAGQDLQNSW